MEFRRIESSSMHPSIQLRQPRSQEFGNMFLFTYNESCFQLYMQNLTIGLNRKLFHLVLEIAYKQLKNKVDMHESWDVGLNILFLSSNMMVLLIVLIVENCMVATFGGHTTTYAHQTHVHSE